MVKGQKRRPGLYPPQEREHIRPRITAGILSQRKLHGTWWPVPAVLTKFCLQTSCPCCMVLYLAGSKGNIREDSWMSLCLHHFLSFGEPSLRHLLCFKTQTLPIIIYHSSDYMSMKTHTGQKKTLNFPSASFSSCLTWLAIITAFTADVEKWHAKTLL